MEKRKITLVLRSHLSGSQRGQRPNLRQRIKPVLTFMSEQIQVFLHHLFFFFLSQNGIKHIFQLSTCILPLLSQLAEVWKTINLAHPAASTSLGTMNDHMKLKAKRKRQGPGELYMYMCL